MNSGANLPGVGDGEWLMIQLPRGIFATSYSVQCRPPWFPCVSAPYTWKFAGSDDGLTWTIIDEHICDSTIAQTAESTTSSFAVLPNKAFMIYAFVIPEVYNLHDGRASVGQFRVFGH